MVNCNAVILIITSVKKQEQGMRELQYLINRGESGKRKHHLMAHSSYFLFYS